MRLASGSHLRIQAFLREHFQNGNLNLPPIVVYCGRCAGWVTRGSNVLAITFGRHIFVAPDKVEREPDGQLRVPAALMAHEATHVLQYQRAGFVRFLVSYLREYAKGLKVQRSIGRTARRSAYLSINYEREAYEAEHAYTNWNPPR
ncbi:MAG: hypothetical protein QOJ64_3423 [Acidobacteriota bacterium]|jgi:hypothetical protein|nr:hypothetical protein [Acidobacteriota bacterium]